MDPYCKEKKISYLPNVLLTAVAIDFTRCLFGSAKFILLLFVILLVVKIKNAFVTSVKVAKFARLV